MSSLLVIFVLGCCSNFVGSESGQRVLNSCRLWSTTQLNTPHCPNFPTHCLYILYLTLGMVGGVGEVREKVEWQQFTRGVENTSMTDCIFSL
jgi:hypothetical protein